MPDDQNVAAVLSQVAAPHLPNQLILHSHKNNNIGLCRSLWIYNTDNTLARRGINICPIKTAIMLKQNSASHVGYTQYAFLVHSVSMHMHRTLRKWDYKSEMYYINCGIILVPKFCIFSMQCEHNTNVGTDALRNWDQYKSQMYYINSGFILVPKFCSYYYCNAFRERITVRMHFFFVSRNKYTQILSWHALGPI